MVLSSYIYPCIALIICGKRLITTYKPIQTPPEAPGVWFKEREDTLITVDRLI